MIQGKNINLRLMKMNDVEKYIELYNNLDNRGEFYPMNFLSIEKYKQEITKNNCWSETWGNMLIVGKNDEMIGLIAYFKSSSYQNGLEVGYNIFQPKDREKGYGTEALKLFTAYLFESRKLERLEINAAVDNIASFKIAEKCGFQYEGKLRKAGFYHGKDTDLVKYSLLKDECPTFKEVRASLQIK